MDQEERLFALMAIVEQQQQSIETALTRINTTVQHMERQRTELASLSQTMARTVADQVSQSVSEKLLAASGSAQQRFIEEFKAQTSSSLKNAEETSRALKRITQLTDQSIAEFSGQLARETAKSQWSSLIIFWVVLILSGGGLIGYTVIETGRHMDNAAYWERAADRAYQKCLKFASCRKEHGLAR